MMNTRSLLSIVLTASLLASATPAFAGTSSYGRNPISYVQDRGYMTGYDNGSFGANNTVNRAEFAKIITLIDRNNRAYSNSSSLPFYDVPSNAWYATYVRYVYSRGFMNGYSGSSFGPNRSITLAEAAKVLAKVYNLNITSQTNAWYDGYVRALANRNAIPVSIDTVNDTLTRGQLADIIYRLDSNDRSQSSRSYDDLTTSYSSYRGSGYHCYYDLNNRYYCDNNDYNYDTYYGTKDNCYYDSNNRYRCDNNSNNNNCYYDNNGNYRCNNNTSNNCYYDSNNRYRCDNNYNNNCYYDSNNRYRCNNNNNYNYNYNNVDTSNGNCVFDSDGNQVCGTANNYGNNCYYDNNGRYRCDNNNYTNNYNSNNCYYDSNNRYRCDNSYNNNSYNDNNCYYDSNGNYRCDNNNTYYNTNNNCYYDQYNNYTCN